MSDNANAVVYKFENLPVEARSRARLQWLGSLGGAMLVILLTPIIWAPWFYSHTVVTLPETGENGLPLDLDIVLSGCDLLALSQGGPQARLSFWRFFGSGTMEVVNNTLRVRATNRRKILMLRCTFVLYLPKAGGASHFNSAKIAISPDQSQKEDPTSCSNTVQMLSVSLLSLRLRRNLEMNISTVARSELKDVVAPFLKARLQGGSFRLRSSAGAAISKAEIVAKDAMAHVTAGMNMQVHLEDDHTFSQVALAAPVVAQANASRAYHLSTESSGRGAAMELSFWAKGSTIFVEASPHHTESLSLAADPLRSDESLLLAASRSCEPLQVVRGQAATGHEAVLLPHTKKMLGHVARWLKEAKNKEEHRYIIYIHLLAPNAPLGMLELLSSPIYEAISLSTASLISGGMLQPHIERVVAPVAGIDWLFPEDPCSKESEQERSIRFAKALLDAVSVEVDIRKMNMSSNRWLWNAKGDAAYNFQWVEEHDQEFWRPQLVTLQDVLPFVMAACITLTLSLASGVAVVLLIILYVIPYLRSELQRGQIMITASYRLNSKQSGSWELSPTMIHWPVRGVLLRWGPRANASQFHSMKFSARMWPDGKAEEGCKGWIRTKRIPVSKLPVYPDLPNQTCFLFVADVHDVESRRSVPHHKHNRDLLELGILQAAQGQIPLKGGRPYQFQVTAYDSNGEVLGASAWSMPTTIEMGRSFSELPLLLWRGLGGLLPSSTFSHFLKEHCVVFPQEPATVIKLRKLRLSVLPNAPELLGMGQVQLYFSTANELKATEPVRLLPPEEQKRRMKAMSQVFPKSDRLKSEDKMVIVLDPFPAEIAMNVSNDLNEKLTVEISLTSEEGDERTVAQWQHTWSHLLDLMRFSPSEDLTDEIVLRSGLHPVAILSANFEICNTMLTSTARPLNPKKNIPEIFAQIRPGATFFWGETVKLDWSTAVTATAARARALELSIVAMPLDLERLSHGLIHGAAQGHLTEKHMLQQVDFSKGQTTLELCPPGLGMMACHLQARTTNDDPQVVACSGQFLLARPVLIQDLELCYAGFCARNGISMERVDANLEAISMVERFFHVLSGFRAPLPVPLEREVVAAGKRTVLIENPSSCAIMPEVPVKLRSSKQEKPNKGSRRGSKMTKGQSKSMMETPLLAASLESEEAVEEGKLKIVVPHRQTMKIPSNVFWRPDGEWFRDPLLWYRFLPLESLGSRTATRGLRALLLTMLFYGQIVAIVIPVLLVFVLAVCHDGVHAAVRADLLRRDATEHHYLLDFIMAPSSFRFWRLDPALQVLQGGAVLYLLLIGATLSYCMVLRFHKSFKQAETFFFYVDEMIKNVTYVLITVFILFATNTLMWVVLGSLIRPEDLIPYAIMVGMAAALSQSMLTKFNRMQFHCSSRLSGLLDKALFAIFKVMANDKSAQQNFHEEEKKFVKLQVDVRKKLPDLERKEAEHMAQMVRLNRQGLEVDDFLCELGLENFEILEEDSGAPQVVQDKQEDQEKKVKALAKSLALHSDTVRFIMNCFEGLVVVKRLRSDSAAQSNSSVQTMASVMAAARKDCLFGHFMRPFEGDSASPPETEPRVLSLLSHLQNEEMETMESVLAKCLSQCLDWSRIIKDAEQFWTEGLLGGVVLDAVERQLSPVIQNSTASQIVLAAFQLGYVYFEQRYRTNPLEIFADCGIVDQEEMKNPQVQYILTAIVDAHFDGCDGNPRKLIQAVRSLILPDEKTALDVSAEPKAYFCFASLVAVLKDLGWSKDELQREYLMQSWRELTEGVCLFEYSSSQQLVTLVLRFSKRGLWKAAAKALLLKIGVGGYAGCQGPAKEAGELAKELQAGDILNIRMVNEKCRWPQDVEDIWKEATLPAAVRAASFGAPQQVPNFLPMDSIPDFLEALVYLPPSEELSSEASKLSPVAPFADAVEDLAWHRGPDGAIWHVRPGGARKLRGLWLEVVLKLFELMECIPSDLDLFFQCKEWATSPQAHSMGSPRQQVTSDGPCGCSFMVRLVTLKRWLKRVYLATLKDCTFNQFQVIVQNMLKCSIPEEALRQEVFMKCPTIPDDDKGELRAVTDLGASLFAYTKHGLWPEALSQVARRMLPTGPIRDYTLRNLDEAFAEMDTQKRGVLEVPEALQLLQVLATPGLTCSDLSHMLENELGLHVPRPELQRYFAMMDINNDGVLQCEEFVQMIRFLMLDFYPHHILKHLNLTLRQIAGFVLLILAGIGLIFFLVTLVVGLFKTGGTLDSLLHSGFVGTFGLIGKRLSDQGIGFEDTMQNLEVKLEAMLGSALVLVLGLSKEMEEVFMGVLKEVESVL